MALKIRMRKHGRTNRPFYRLVVTDSRTKRDGKYLESVGWYDPLADKEGENTSLNAERIKHWLDHGAQLSESAEALVRKSFPEILREIKQREIQRKLKLREKKVKSRKAKEAVKKG